MITFVIDTVRRGARRLDLLLTLREGDRKLGGRIHIAKEDISECVASLLTSEEHRDCSICFARPVGDDGSGSERDDDKGDEDEGDEDEGDEHEEEVDDESGDEQEEDDWMTEEGEYLCEVPGPVRKSTGPLSR